MTESILNSSQAVSILRHLSQKKEGMYTKEIAEEMDKSVNTVSNMIRNLFRLGLVEKGKRTKAQYYRISPEGIANFVLDEIDRYYIEEINDSEFLEGLYEDFEEYREEVKEFLMYEYPFALQTIPEGKSPNLKEFLFTAEALKISKIKERHPEWIEKEEYLPTLQLVFTQYTELPLDIMSIADYAQEDLNTNLVEHQ